VAVFAPIGPLLAYPLRHRDRQMPPVRDDEEYGHMRFKRFTNPTFLRHIGRHWLGRLFERLAPDLAARGIALPSPDLDDDAYFVELAKLAMSPDALPEQAVEDLYAIESVSSYQGVERLRAAAKELGVQYEETIESTVEDMVVQLYLSNPRLVIRKHNEMKLVRVRSFEYFRRNYAPDPNRNFQAPDRAVLSRIEEDINEWCRKFNRGDRTVRVDVYEIDGEFWFPIRRGDYFTRTPTVDQGRFVILHFRPAKDDAVVYCPWRDELRVHAATWSERDFYRSVFGLRLFDNPIYFNMSLDYTLEPLRESGVDALSTAGVEGLNMVVLREIEYEFNTPNAEVINHSALNLFSTHHRRPLGPDPIPAGAKLLRATFDFHFERVSRPRKVQLRPPNTLRYGRACDGRIIEQWISARGFRQSTRKSEEIAF